MRAVKSLILLAGQLRREDLEEDEEDIVIMAMKSSNHPKLKKEDIPLFESIVQDLFPSKELKQLRHPDLEEAIQSICDKNGFFNSEIFTQKSLQLHDTLRVKNGVIVIG